MDGLGNGKEGTGNGIAQPSKAKAQTRTAKQRQRWGWQWKSLAKQRQSATMVGNGKALICSAKQRQGVGPYSEGKGNLSKRSEVK